MPHSDLMDAGVRQLQKARGYFAQLEREVKDAPKALEEPGFRAALDAKATEIVDRVVYQAYTPRKYKRTFTLLRSVDVGDAEESLFGSGVSVFIPDTPELQGVRSVFMGREFARQGLRFEFEETGFNYGALLLWGPTEHPYWAGDPGEEPRSSLPRPYLDAWFSELPAFAEEQVLVVLDAAIRGAA
jgi:hypothetical protein